MRIVYDVRDGPATSTASLWAADDVCTQLIIIVIYTKVLRLNSSAVCTVFDSIYLSAQTCTRRQNSLAVGISLLVAVGRTLFFITIRECGVAMF